VGTKGLEKLNTNYQNPKRAFHVMRCLAQRYEDGKRIDPNQREKFASINFIKEQVQRSMNKSQRNEDIKACVEYFHRANQIEIEESEDGRRYRIAKEGYEEYVKHGAYLSMYIRPIIRT